MDPLSALSLAGNVVQFTQFAFGLVNGATAIYNSPYGTSADSQHLEAIHTILSDFSLSMQTWLSSATLGTSGHGASRYAASLLELTGSCKQDCDELLAILRRLQVQPGLRNRLWRSFQKALLEVWKKEDITRLMERIQDTQRTMVMMLCAVSSENVENSSIQLRELRNGKSSLHAERMRQVELLMSSLADIRIAVDQIRDRIDYKDPRIPNMKRSQARDLMISGTSEDDPQQKPPCHELRHGDLDVLTTEISKLRVAERHFVKEEAVLTSLDLEKRSARHVTIADAHRATFKWICDAQTIGDAAAIHFTRWLKSGKGTFWITGKPGSGKSTLMKVITDHIRKGNSPLTEWAKPKKLVVATHYFWSAGTVMQRSQEGLLRTLLFNILAQVPELIPNLCEKRWAEAIDASVPPKPWTLSELRSVLRELTSKHQHLPVKFCFFVDGLDEFDGDMDVICRDMLELATDHVKLCISSWPWNVFEDHFGSDAAQKLSVHELTSEDIRNYTRDRLHEHPRWTVATRRDSDMASDLVDTITTRANGVFLWVYLVTEKLRSGLTNDDSITDLRMRLESIPTDLEQFYKQIIESIAVAAYVPLPLDVYCFHDLEYTDEAYALKQPVKAMSHAEMASFLEPAKRRINGRCQGLLEIREGHVEFFYRTVCDFLMTGQMMRFLRERTREDFDPDLSALKAYVAWIKRSSWFNIVDDGTLYRQGCFMENGVRLWRDSFNGTMDSALTFARRSMQPDKRYEALSVELLDDLEASVETMAIDIAALRKEDTQETTHQRARLLFRKMLIEHDLPAYISIKMTGNPRYFADIHQSPLRVALKTFAAELRYLDEMAVGRPDEETEQMRINETVEVLVRHGYSSNEHPACINSLHPLDTVTEDPDTTPVAELLSQLIMLATRPEDRRITLDQGAQSIIGYVLECGIISTLLKGGADWNAPVRIVSKDRAHQGFPQKVSACTSYILLAFLVDKCWKHAGPYLQDLRAMLSQADYGRLRLDLFREGDELETYGRPGCLFSLLLSIMIRERRSRNMKKQQFQAKVLCELARFDTYGLPWENLGSTLKDTFPENLLERIEHAINSRTRRSVSQIPVGTPVLRHNNKRPVDCAEEPQPLQKRVKEG